MSAMAGALGVRLEKRGAYVLGAEFPPPCPKDIGRAVMLARGAALYLGAGITGALLATRGLR
jgi:adenosylcobinamide-phosphate synthase